MIRLALLGLASAALAPVRAVRAVCAVACDVLMVCVCPVATLDGIEEDDDD